MLTALALAALAAWLYLAALHGGFWRSDRELTVQEPQQTPSVTVIVPARNEAEHIQQSIGSLLGQRYDGELAVVLVDDNSSDGTAALASALEGGERLTILSGGPLPPGWSGKLWAVDQGLRHPLARAAELILLTDADIEHDPRHVAALVAKVEQEGLDLVSEMVALNSSTWAERALIPAFVFFFQMLYPFAWVANPRRRTAGAAGGTMLVRRAALDGVEGVERIRQCLIDDCALAGQIKGNSGRLWLGHTTRTRSLRVYGSWREIAAMIARTAYVQLKHSPLLLAGCVAGLLLLYVVPPALALAAHGLPRVLGLAAWLTMALLFQPTLRRYRRWPLWGLALPGIGLFYLSATITSALRHHAGRGGGWKERVYPESSASTP